MAQSPAPSSASVTLNKFSINTLNLNKGRDIICAFKTRLKQLIMFGIVTNLKSND